MESDRCLVVYRSKRRLLLFALGYLVSLCILVIIAAHGDELRINPVRYIFLTFIATPLMIWALLFTIRRMLMPRPIIVVDRDGIHGTMPELPIELIRWEQIAAFMTYRVIYSSYFVVVPKSTTTLSKLIHDQPFIHRVLLRLNQTVVPGSFNVSWSLAGMPLATFLEQVQVRFEDQIREQSISVTMLERRRAQTRGDGHRHE